ncbi:hypothetical protein C0J52_28023 [Blattella germanica]|nr:hypothetical protein C0J52_28023 [Blattella germanica]
MVFHLVAKELSSRGHELVLITANPVNDSRLINYEQINVYTLVDTWKNRFNYINLIEDGVSLKTFTSNAMEVSIDICFNVFEHPEINKLIEKGLENKFDLVIIGWLINPCFSAFAHHFSVPFIGLSAMGLFYSNHDSIGNPTHPIYGNEVFHHALKQPTLWEKLYRIFHFVSFKWHWHFKLLPTQDRLTRKYFGDSLPYLGELEKNISLVFTIHQSIIHNVFPQVPALIELGPIHLRETKPLPKGARILLISTIPIRSHDMVFHLVAKELSSRGHELVLITANPVNDSGLINYEQINVYTLVDTWKNRFNYINLIEDGVSLKTFTSNAMEVSIDICFNVFEHPEINKLIEKGLENKFDLVIIGWLINPCFSAFAHHFSVPFIGLSAMGLFYSNHDSIGNPTHPIYGNEVFHHALKQPTLWEKLYRIFHFVSFKWHWHFKLLPTQDRLTRKYFGDSLPYLGELEKNISLVFTIHQSIIHNVFPQVPALIELGPIHLRETKPLPKELKEFLDGSPEGVVYFSFGSHVRTDGMPSTKIKMFLDAFSELTQFRILWKWESDEPPAQLSNELKEFLDGSPEGVVYFSFGSHVRTDGMPSTKIKMFLDAFSELTQFRILWKWESDEPPAQLSNVMFRKWIPQQDILGEI